MNESATAWPTIVHRESAFYDVNYMVAIPISFAQLNWLAGRINRVATAADNI